MEELLIPIVILGIIIWVISAVVNSVKDSAKNLASRQKEALAIKNKYPNINIDKNKSLEERNQDLIQDHLLQLRQDSWPHYVENKVSDCIKEIALREGSPSIAPKSREWLPLWEKRQGIPNEYIQLKNSLLTQFKEKYKQVVKENKERQEIVEKEYQAKKENETTEFLSQRKDVIEKFLEIAERKVSIIDDYGDESWDTLPKEIEACIKKIAKIDGIDDEIVKDFLKKDYGWKMPEHYSELKTVLEKIFREYHSNQKNKPETNINLNNLSGVEFETHLSKIFKDCGYDVSGTATTGDQGADLLARKNGKTIVIQAKRYQGTVGNKAVQEVVSAVSFYGGNEGWVITNSTFTPSAKALAQKNNVRLVDGHSLQDIKTLI